MVDVIQMLLAHMKLKQMQLYVFAKPAIQIQVQIRQLCVLVRSNLRKTYFHPQPRNILFFSLFQTVAS